MTVGLGPASEPELPGTASLDKPGASLRQRERECQLEKLNKMTDTSSSSVWPELTPSKIAD